MKKIMLLSPLAILAIAGFKSFSPDSHIEGHVEKPPQNVVYFSNNGTTSPILMMNNTGLEFQGKTEVGFHIALLPYKDKYIPLGYDIVPIRDHKNAEQYVMKYAKQNGLAELPVEQYPAEVIVNAEKFCISDSGLNNIEKEKILLVIRQTREYMKTEYFAKIYKDGNRVKSAQEVADWITENTVTPDEFILGKVSEQTIQLKND